jgi:nucleotide-binding universal stress UspA family protein
VKKFLVATDLSGRSDRALQRAVALAHECVAEIEIVHVVDDSYAGEAGEQLEMVAREKIRDQIAALNIQKEETCRTTVVRGHDYVEIIERAEAIGADLIILGTPRQSPRGLFRGTTAERIIHWGHIPVLVVREPVAKSYQVLLVGIDLSVHSRRALQFAAELIPGGDFYLVHATHEPFRAFIDRGTIKDLVLQEQNEFKKMIAPDIAELTALMKPNDPRFEVIFGQGLAETVMRDQIARLRPDLVVIGTHGRTGIAHAVLGSVAENLLADAPADILAVKAW